MRRGLKNAEVLWARELLLQVTSISLRRSDSSQRGAKTWPVSIPEIDWGSARNEWVNQLCDCDCCYPNSSRFVSRTRKKRLITYFVLHLKIICVSLTHIPFSPFYSIIQNCKNRLTKWFMVVHFFFKLLESQFHPYSLYTLHKDAIN